MGNRLSLTDNLTSEQTLYTYDDFNKLLTAGSRSFTYDADGNCTSVALQGAGVTRTYSWGYNNELAQITYGGGGTNTFRYDGSGRRVTKTDSTGSYSFVYDGERIISDGQAVYTRAGGSRLISERRGNNSKWHHSDGLTSTRTLTNNSQTTTDTFRYDVWGDLAERTGTTPTPHQFVGALGYEREADSGLYFIGTRYYDPSVGRFLSQDPAQAGVNWYIYAANNPVSAFERQGLIWETLIDVAGLVYDVYEFVCDPSWEGAGWIAADVGGMLLPFIPSPGAVKVGGKVLGGLVDEAIDIANHADDLPPIALGLNPPPGYNQLKNFADNTGSVAWWDWPNAGLTNADVHDFPGGFVQGFEDATLRTPKINFDLTGFDFNQAWGVMDPLNGVTNWEFNQIISDPGLLDKTVFRYDGNPIPILGR